MSYQSTTHLVGHLMREVESALRDVLKPQAPEEDVGRNSRHSREIRGILEALHIPEEHAVSQLWLSLPGHAGLQGRAHRDALFTPRPVDEDFLALWNALQAILDFVLERFEQTYLDYLKALDELASIQNPTRTEAKRLKDQAPNNLIAHGYFFNKLTTVEWLEPLAAEGLFQRPPAPEPHENGIHFVLWPQARYLARVAPDAPQAVADIILEIPYTENIGVLMDLAEAACAMPPDQAVRLIDQAKAWASGPYAALMLLPERLGRLISHLADGGYVEAALGLAKVVLSLKRPPEESNQPSAQDGFRLRIRPEAILSDWDYKEILRLRMPALVRSSGLDALRLICDSLDEALGIKRDAGKEGGDAQLIREDYSRIWRGNIASPSHPGNEDVQNSLVDAVRDAALQVVSNHPDLIDEIVGELEGRRWTVFWRISLDILRQAATIGLPLACTRLADENLANNHGLESEYLQLLGAVFATLSSDCRRQILALIEAGPITSDLREDLDKDRYISRWRWQMLAAIRNALPAEWQNEWQRLGAEFGNDLELRREGMIASWAGHPEAAGVERLGAMPLQEIGEFVGGFEPGDGFNEPSADDLARELAQAVAADPGRFASGISVFNDVSLVYKGGLVHGFKDAAEGGRVFDWGPVLILCQQVVSEAGTLSDRDSASARRATVDLIHSGLAPKGTEIAFEFRLRVWEILADLMEDPDPSTQRESEGSGFGPYELAINTTRGRAVEAAVYYGIWVCRHTNSEGGHDDTFTLDQAPELQEALERHLDLRVDSSLAVRSVYGVYLPTLYGLDASWVSDNRGKLFPKDETRAGMRQATWEGYVCYARLNLSMLNLLRDEYDRSIELLGSPNLEERRKPDEPLGKHLMIFYWHGRLDLDDPMLIRFFEVASDEVRAQALANVGQNLRADHEPLPDDVAARLKALWEWRIERARTGVAGDYQAEMAAFGWTFASGELGDYWGLGQLEATLSVAGQAAVDHLVAARLASLAADYPADAVRCLGLLVDGAKEAWQIHHWANDVEAILTSGLRSGDDDASQATRSLINRRGARGFLQFASLLQD